MIKYKNENQTLYLKIQELEQTIKANNTKFFVQRKEILDVQTQLKKENFEYNTQILDLQNKIGIFVNII